MSKEMLINNVEGLECRIAIVKSGILEELYIERASSQSHVGNVYKGRVLNVEASIQAAFVDFGLPKNGFLHISDVHPQFFPKNKGWAATEPVGHKCPHRDRPPIQECLRRGQEVVVQVTKEGIGTKGPTLTSYVSIPGRMMVIMPGMCKLGISRKIETDEDRAQARTAMGELTFPPEYGFILRTAGLGRNKRDLQRDLNYLVRLWKTVDERIRSAVTPCEIYRESDLVIRTIRDVYGSDIDRVVCDDPEVARKVSEFISVAMPRSKHIVERYTGRDGLFHDAGLEEEIERIYARKVELPGGGSLIIDQTEALVAIDVNSGRFREHSDAETTASKINITAANEIGRQLRLRDLGGMILIDFIDMRESHNCRAVEKALRTALINDRAKSKILKMSAFGIVEMTRQRLGPSLRHSVYSVCAHCDGMGLIKSPESQALQAMRMLRRAIANEEVIRVEVTVTMPVAHELANRHRAALAALEAAAGKRILLTASDALKGEEIRVNCLNTRGTEVAWELTEHSPTRTPLITVGCDEVVVLDDETSDEEQMEEVIVAGESEELEAEAEEPEDAPASDGLQPRQGEGGGRRRRGRRRGGEGRQRPPQQGQRGQATEGQSHAHQDRQPQRPPQGRQEGQQRGSQNQQQQRQQPQKQQQPPKQQQQPQNQKQQQPKQQQQQPKQQQQQPGQEGLPGAAGAGVKSRRRGRRGGRKHRRGDGQPNGGQMPQQGTPAQAAGHAPDEGLFRAEPAAQVPPVQVQRIEPAVAPQVPPSEASPAPAWKLTAERTPVEKPPVAAAPAAAPAAEVAPAAKKSRKPRRPAAKKKPSAKKKSSLPDPNAIPEDTLGDDSFTDDV